MVRRLLGWLTVFACLGLFGFMCQRVAERGRFVGAYSSYGSGPDGARGLFLLSEALGARPRRWSQDLARLPQGAMLVALGGCGTGMARPMERYEDRELQRWVEGGGTLLVAGARHYLSEGLGVRFEVDPQCQTDMRFGSTRQADRQDSTPQPAGPGLAPGLDAGVDAGADAGAPADGGADAGALVDGEEPDPEQPEPPLWSVAEGPLKGLEPVPMLRPGRFVFDDGVEYTTLLTAQDAPSIPQSSVRRATAVVVRHGQGRVIALSSASLLQNHNLAAADGGALFARLLRRYGPAGPLLFDEYHLGVGERRSQMQYLRSVGALPFFAQALLVALLLLARAGARFGGLRAEPRPAPAGTASFVSAMGHLFARTQDPSGALTIVVREALSRIAVHHHLQGGAAGPLELALRERGALDAAAAVREIGEVGGTGVAADAGLAAAVRRIDRAAARAMA